MVTGASSGIGRAVAVEASKYGARVALLARNVSKLEETRALMAGDGHMTLSCDLTLLNGIGGAVRTVSTQLGGLDGVVHAAGMHQAAPLRIVEPSDYHELFDLNVGSALMVAKAFRHKQVRRPNASLVFLSSAVGVVGQPGVSLYSASKGAILALTKSLALELVRDGIRVNCVSPGVVQTAMTQSLAETIGSQSFETVKAAHPLGLGLPEDVAAAVLYLLSPASQWVTGTSLTVDGGYTAQ
ncbi:SDR family NAD(P)-dependent oxidoreductase [Cryobacterium sp. Hh38]|uniref:SDR family NAD(P)-dependent oxidoreductase n=1 Tax=Cryobacterium sp. Hh38 TaxID=1259156 RepID=UPI002102FEF4|nr:SDR family oxidoreductase [Cryobacterium sp. Hh38]